jgi:cytochrome b subunit of formate dehydrogenase
MIIQAPSVGLPLVLLSLIAALFSPGMPAGGALPKQATACLECHGDPDVAPDARLAAFDTSVHEGMDCTECHEGVLDYPHDGHPLRVDCGECHDEAARSLTGAAHGAGLIKEWGSLARACAACHGHAHDMPPLKHSASPVSRENQIAMCGACHADSKSPTSIAAVNHPLDSYLKSIHGQLNHQGRVDAALCSDCHGAHDIRPKYDPLSPIFAANIPRTCGRCHEQAALHYQSSIHGIALAHGVREAPTCTDCHGEHSIRPPDEDGSRVSKSSISRTCSGCHAAEHMNAKYSMPSDRIRTFDKSYHGLSAQAGSWTAANCSSCHGWHNVRSSTDPASTVHPSNLGRTCGECHPGAGAKFADTRIHETLSGAGSPLARAFEIAYMILIPLVIGSMIIHNTLDLVRKSRARSPLPPARLHPEIHMSMQERLQHGVMVITFLTLGYSGFALKYPGDWWAAPFLYLGGEEGRRFFHRGAALFFALVCVWHLAWLFVAREGRVLLKDMVFKFRDVTDMVNTLRFYLKWSPVRPPLPRYSYIEKAEYWALVWGTMVMLLTGAILLFHNMALQYAPLWVLDVARIVHYMEAVLACLAILVWHFYWVIYDPDVYPMNAAWITGQHTLRNHALPENPAPDTEHSSGGEEKEVSSEQ